MGQVQATWAAEVVGTAPRKEGRIATLLSWCSLVLKRPEYLELQTKAVARSAVQSQSSDLPLASRSSLTDESSGTVYESALTACASLG